MAGTGSPPAERRRRTNKDTYADVQATVTPDETLRGPELEGSWRPETLAWYATWRKSPQSEVFLDTDWVRLAMVARLVEQFYAGLGNPNVLTEIRLNESLLGATHVDRLKARIKVEPKPGPTKKTGDSRTERALRLAG